MGRWGHNWWSLAIDIVDWLLVLSSESRSMLGNVSEAVGLDMVGVLVEGDAGLGGFCVSSSGVVHRVPFIATRYVSN